MDNAIPEYDMEVLAEAVHKSYCDYYKTNNDGEEYWTKGDYSLLDEPTKQIDRETVKAVLNALFPPITAVISIIDLKGQNRS
jgi:hypothetical protein